MCCENFWKRAVSFLLAFGLGLFLTGWFASDNQPLAESSYVSLLEEKIFSEKENLMLHSPSEKKNCVPTDELLKYKYLSDSENQTAVLNKLSLLNKEIVEIEEIEAKSKSQKHKKVLRRMIEKIEKQMRLTHSINHHNLLYLEKCFDSDGRKPSPKTHH